MSINTCKQYTCSWEFILMLITFTFTTTNMSSNIFTCCVFRAAAVTFVNDFTWTHCVSSLFNTAWFLYMLLLTGLKFFDTTTKQEKTYLKPRCTPFPGNMSFNPETVAKHWAPVWAWTWPSSAKQQWLNQWCEFGAGLSVCRTNNRQGSHFGNLFQNIHYFYISFDLNCTLSPLSQAQKCQHNKCA